MYDGICTTMDVADPDVVPNSRTNFFDDTVQCRGNRLADHRNLDCADLGNRDGQHDNDLLDRDSAIGQRMFLDFRLQFHSGNSYTMHKQHENLCTAVGRKINQAAVADLANAMDLFRCVLASDDVEARTLARHRLFDRRTEAANGRLPQVRKRNERTVRRIDLIQGRFDSSGCLKQPRDLTVITDVDQFC